MFLFDCSSRRKGRARSLRAARDHSRFLGWILAGIFVRMTMVLLSVYTIFAAVLNVQQSPALNEPKSQQKLHKNFTRSNLEKTKAVEKIQPVTKASFAATKEVEPGPNNRSRSKSSSSFPSNNDSLCSCHSSRTTMQCCHRCITTSHKMGTFLVEEIFGPYLTEYGRWKNAPSKYRPTSGQTALPKLLILQSMNFECIVSDDMVDYRHIALVRNPFDAIVSGYLYHKTGRECHLDFYGRPWPKDMLRSDFARYLNMDMSAYPPIHNRSLCEYLAQEPERIGLRVYMDFSLNKFYPNALRYWKSVHKQESPCRTLFICLEEIPDPSYCPDVFYRSMQWLYPGEGPGKNLSGLLQLPAQQPRLAKGHATQGENSAAMRQRLRTLVRQFDQTRLNNQLAVLERLYKCNTKKDAVLPTAGAQ